MMQQESIYKIVPKAKIIPGKDALYKSTHPYYVAPTASTFKLINSSYPNVSNMGGETRLPRGAHPLLRDSATFGIPDVGKSVSPENYHRKGPIGRKLPPLERLHTSTEVRKPPVPTLKDKPIMGLKTDKNYITANAVDNILMAPKKLTTGEEFPRLLKVRNVYKDKHKYYGQIPTYITNLRLKIKEEYDTLQEMKRRKKEEEDAKQRLLTQDEVAELRQGLQKKWEMYNQRYAKMTHKKVFDNLVLLRK